MDSNPRHMKALAMLIIATVFWGLSFPVMKSLGLIQQRVVPECDSWFGTSLTIMVRFGVAGIIVLGACWRTICKTTRLELGQGLGLALFGGTGLVFQMDGLSYTSASSSAFLTQAYCLILPWIVALRDRQWPSGILVASSLLMIVGMGILAEIDPRHFRLGRGELETLIASLLFAGQILWLERPIYQKNKVNHFTTVMFFGTALTVLPIILVTMKHPRHLMTVFSGPGTWVLTSVLVLLCTLIPYLLMNYWQPHVSAPEAGLIYGVEPVFATFFALFLPGWISRVAGLNYLNETTNRHLLLGGGLIIFANVIIQAAPQKISRSGDPH